MTSRHTLKGILMSAMLLFSISAYSQILYTYAGDESGAPGTVVTGISVSDLDQVNGLLTDAAACGDGFNSKAYSLSTGSFSTAYTAVEFTVTPASGYEVTITQMDFRLRRNNNGPKRMRFAYSINGGATWVDQGTDISVPFVNCNTGSVFTWDMTDIVSTTPVTFRIYGWDANNVSGVGSERDGTLYGTVCALNPWYADADGDGYGDDATGLLSCTAPVGYVSDNTDCNDANAAINPGAAEVCNGIDDNCNGSSDEGLTFTTYYADADGDGYGDAATSVSACSVPAGYVLDNTDCDDTQNTVYPGADEICDGLDNDCDGDYDEGLGTATISPAVEAFTCKGDDFTFTANDCDGCTYQWFKNDNVIIGATEMTYATTKPAYYSVQVTTAGGCFAVSEHTLLTTQLNPNANIYNPNGLNLCAPSPGTNIIVKVGYTATNTYQWYRNGEPYTGDGANSYRIFPSETGDYYCSITAESGCNRVTETRTVINSCRTSADMNAEMISVYPNPASNNFTIELFTSSTEETGTIVIVNSIGEIVYSSIASFNNGELNENINLNTVPSGLYFVKIVAGEKEYTSNLVINK